MGTGSPEKAPPGNSAKIDLLRVKCKPDFRTQSPDSSFWPSHRRTLMDAEGVQGTEDAEAEDTGLGQRKTTPPHLHDTEVKSGRFLLSPSTLIHSSLQVHLNQPFLLQGLMASQLINNMQVELFILLPSLAWCSSVSETTVGASEDVSCSSSTCRSLGQTGNADSWDCAVALRMEISFCADEKSLS
ncbi:hypothetical protein MJG53_010453 [Ovis ammon polii x Ovis aries]|uniref:Uncharacterized protein n=2 Tax=Ovis TaxID=9935 RepID=A0A836A1B4_SHEEP|nr:hypothetical protein JEQ12_006103 [Ovis aries]KAI4580911.1 hypothetical protein MJG53_010453 [Ovis ammon polii x Ovis aries]